MSCYGTVLMSEGDVNLSLLRGCRLYVCADVLAVIALWIPSISSAQHLPQPQISLLLTYIILTTLAVYITTIPVTKSSIVL